MAITSTGHHFPTQFFGLSTDTKPTDAMIGATLLETNTQKWFVWEGSNWRRREEGMLFADSGQLDAFGRLRTAQPLTIFDSNQLFDNQPLFWDETTVSDITTAHSVDTASTVITYDGGATGGTFTRQTFMRFNYQPGKSQQIMMTGILDRSGGGTGIQRRIGIFDDDNGLFYEDDAGTIGVTRRTNVTGTAADNTVTQANWNLDKMDGTGPSGITIDWTKTQIFYIDYEWLGVGRVRMCLVLDGRIHGVHEFTNTNLIDKVYMSTPNLPLRFQLIADANSTVSTMECICGTVISEGGQSELGVQFHRSTAGTPIDMDTEDTLYSIVGLRLKSTHFGATVKIVKLAVTLQSASDDIEWVLVFDPAIAGTPGWTNKDNSAVQYFIGASTNTVTGGTHVDAGYASTGTGQSAAAGTAEFVSNALRLGAKIDGTAQSIVLCARPINGSATDVLVEGGLTWREIS